MKSLLLAIGMLIGFAASSQTKISIDSISAYYLKQVNVCAVVSSVKELDKISFLNLGGTYPNQKLTVVISKSDMPYFKKPLVEYQGKEVCIEGLITEYPARSGKYQIKIKDEAQIKIVE